MARRRLLVLEFTELCPSLLDRWMAEVELPTVLDFFGVDPRTIPQVRGRDLPVRGERTETVPAPLAA